MPLRTQHPVYGRFSHRNEPIEHTPKESRKPRVKKKVRGEKREQRRSQREEQDLLRMREHEKRVHPLGTPEAYAEYLEERQAKRVEVERSYARTKAECRYKKLHHVRRRSPKYYQRWLRRLTSYVHRCYAREKRLPKRTVLAAKRVGLVN